MELRLKKILLQEMEAILLAMIICFNAVRFILGVYENILLTLSIYGLFCICVLIFEKKQKIISGNIIVLFGVSILIILYALASSLFNVDERMGLAIKIIFIFIVCSFAYLMRLKLIERTLEYIIYICVFFGGIVLFGIKSVDNYIRNFGANYLTLTLPLALALTIVLCRFVCRICYKDMNINYLLGDLFCIVILYMSILKFAARGSILFPFFCALIMPFFILKKNRLNLSKIYLIICAFAYIAYRLFIKYANAYTIMRMQSLINNMGSEDRIEIWRKCIELLFDKFWFIFGGGLEAYEMATGYYPHNIIIQFWGEFGVIGLLFVFSCIYYIILSVIQVSKKITSGTVETSDAVTYWTLVSGLLFLFMTFMKSFSIYDGITIYLFVVLVLRASNSKEIVFDV